MNPFNESTGRVVAEFPPGIVPICIIDRLRLLPLGQMDYRATFNPRHRKIEFPTCGEINTIGQR